jgi:hypothetical protein
MATASLSRRAGTSPRCPPCFLMPIHSWQACAGGILETASASTLVHHSTTLSAWRPMCRLAADDAALSARCRMANLALPRVAAENSAALGSDIHSCADGQAAGPVLKIATHVMVDFTKPTIWRKAIESGVINSCRGSHEEWLAAAQK